MEMQDIIVYIIVAGCIVFMCRHYLKIIFRKKGKSPGCGCGCDSCPHKKRK